MFVRSSLASAIAAGLSLVLSQAVLAHDASSESAATNAAAASAASTAAEDDKKSMNSKPFR